MIKISLQITKLHPTIVSAIRENGAHDERVLTEINTLIDEATNGKESKVEYSGSIKSKETAKHVTVTADGKLKGMTLPKDSAAGLLARLNWYLDGSRELYTRITSLELPSSVIAWLGKKELQMTAEEKAAWETKLAELREKVAKARA
jgi:hypothetical protein